MYLVSSALILVAIVMFTIANLYYSRSESGLALMVSAAVSALIGIFFGLLRCILDLV